MEPRIRRSINQGFRSTNQSIPGMAVLASWWLLAWLLMGVVAAGTNIPPALWQEPGSAEEALRQPAATPRARTQSTADTTGTAQTVAAPSEASGSETSAADRTEVLRTTVAEQGRIALEWLGRAWPALLVACLVLLAGNLWLQGGQIGYLARIVQAQSAGVSEMWASGGRAFGALAGATLFSLVASALLAVALLLIGGLLSALSPVVPGWLTGLLGLLLFVAVVTGLVWLGVRLTFWFIDIVLERVGPVAGLKASFRFTRGRWWKVFQLGAALGLLAAGVLGIIRLLGWVATLIGGPLGVVAVVLTTILSVLANLYVSFLLPAALIQFYLDVKSGSAPVAGMVAQ